MQVGSAVERGHPVTLFAYDLPIGGTEVFVVHLTEPAGHDRAGHPRATDGASDDSDRRRLVVRVMTALAEVESPPQPKPWVRRDARWLVPVVVGAVDAVAFAIVAPNVNDIFAATARESAVLHGVGLELLVRLVRRRLDAGQLLGAHAVPVRRDRRDLRWPRSPPLRSLRWPGWRCAAPRIRSPGCGSPTLTAGAEPVERTRAVRARLPRSASPPSLFVIAAAPWLAALASRC